MSAINTFKLLFLAALWGSSFIFIRIVSPSLGPILTTFLRVFIASITMLVYFRMIHVDIHWKLHWRKYVMIGLINSALPFCLYSFAGLYIPASYSVILNSTSPFFGALFSWIMFKEHFSVRQIGGLILGVIGVSLVVKIAQVNNDQYFYFSLLACLAAAACYGFSGNFVKKIANEVPALGIAAGSQIGASFILIGPTLLQPAPQNVTVGVILALLALATMCSALAYILYYQLMAEVGATKALTVTLLMPPFGMLWGFTFLNEVITLQMIIGTVLILIGTYGVVKVKAS